MKKGFGRPLIILAVVLIVSGCAGTQEQRSSSRPGVGSQPGNNRVGALTLALEIGKDSYLEDEAIVVRVSLENGTTRALRIVPPSLVIQTLKFIITDSDGRILRYSGSVAKVGITDDSGRTITPGKNLTVTYPLAGRYIFASPPTGHYTIKGVYRFSQPGTSLWSGLLESDTLTFSIIEKE